jgi:hypothetical protein
MKRVISVGLVAGLIWGGLWQLCYIFHFTKYSPGFIIILVASLLTAIICRAIAGWGHANVRFILLTIVFASIVAVCDPAGPFVQMFSAIDWNTLIVDCCLIAQWVLFIEVSVNRPKMIENLGKYSH